MSSKERDPALTLRKTKEILKNDGVEISIKGIRGIWKRYGYGGFDKDSSSSDFADYIPWSKGASVGAKAALTIFSGPLQFPEDKECKVFDITGRVVAPNYDEMWCLCC